MPDVFLSYSHEDQAAAQRFAEAFEAQGMSVWWDAAVRSGEAFDQLIEEALEAAKAVVVLWSRTSVVSRWVRAEATIADRKRTLVPVMIEPCQRPIMFELTHTTDLSHWKGDKGDKAWLAFLGDVQRMVGASPASAASQAPPALALPDKPSIAVLPFANMTGMKEQDYFSDGMAEEITTALTRFSSSPRTSCQRRGHWQRLSNQTLWRHCSMQRATRCSGNCGAWPLPRCWATMQGLREAVE